MADSYPFRFRAVFIFCTLLYNNVKALLLLWYSFNLPKILYAGDALKSSFRSLKKRYDFSFKSSTPNILLLCLAGISDLKFWQISQCPEMVCNHKYMQLTAINNTLFFYRSHLLIVATMQPIICLNILTKSCK